MIKATVKIATAGKVNRSGIWWTEEGLKQLQKQILPGRIVYKDGKQIGKVEMVVLEHGSLLVTLSLNKRGEKILQWEELKISMS